MNDMAALLADVEAALERAYQMGRLEVTGQVNIQRIRALKERYDSLREQLETTPSDELIRKANRLRRQLRRACEVGIRNEAQLEKLTDAG